MVSCSAIVLLGQLSKVIVPLKGCLIIIIIIIIFIIIN